MPPPRSADEHYRRNAEIVAPALLNLDGLWSRLRTDLDDWEDLAPIALAVLTGAQEDAAAEAARYVPAVLDELGIPDDPVAEVDRSQVVGVAASGVDLGALMGLPVIAARVALSQGRSLALAKQSGGALLQGIAQTQVIDAGRAIESVEMAVRPAVGGFVRMLQLPSCKRCVVLAGKFYRWNEGFDRHPRCDCYHLPVESADAAPLDPLGTDPIAAIRAGKVTGLSAADQRAIVEDGADPAQVINAQRGMQVGQVLGVGQVKSTTEGISSRGVAGRRLGQLERAGGVGRTGKSKRYRESQVQRLRPETIYRLAGDDRAEAQRLLYRFGYLTNPPS